MAIPAQFFVGGGGGGYPTGDTLLPAAAVAVVAVVVAVVVGVGSEVEGRGRAGAAEEEGDDDIAAVISIVGNILMDGIRGGRGPLMRR